MRDVVDVISMLIRVDMGCRMRHAMNVLCKNLVSSDRNNEERHYSKSKPSHDKPFTSSDIFIEAGGK